MRAVQAIGAGYFERAVLSGDAIHALVLANVEIEIVSHPAVIFQSLVTIWFLVEAGHRDVADLEQFRRSEKRHVGGVVVKRIHHAPFLHQKDRKSTRLNSSHVEISYAVFCLK